MKITKEEKSLYNFLKVVATIFSKSTSRNLIFGNKNELVFQSGAYAGMFKHNKRDTTLFDEYNFGAKFYELKQLPNGNYVLDAYITADIITQDERFRILETASQCANNTNTFVCELKKDDPLKLSKIVASSELWICDNDLKFINAFPETELFKLDDKLIIKSMGLTDDDVAEVTTVLIINTEPKDMQYMQQKVALEPTYDEEEDTVEEQLDELLEEEYDPMSD